MKLDFCTMMISKKEWPLLPLHYNSMRHYMGEECNSFKISVPDNTETIEYCKQFPGLEVLIHPMYVQADKAGGMRQVGYDTANRMDLLMKACTADWVVMSQMDIIYTGNIVKEAEPYLNDDYGVLGTFPHGLTIVNRKAYGYMHYGFWPVTCLTVDVLNDAHVRLCGPDTPMGNGKKYGVLGVDTGEFPTIEMPIYGYKYSIAPCVHLYHHIGGGAWPYEGEGEQEAKKTYEERLAFALKQFAKFR